MSDKVERNSGPGTSRRVFLTGAVGVGAAAVSGAVVGGITGSGEVETDTHGGGIHTHLVDGVVFAHTHAARTHTLAHGGTIHTNNLQHGGGAHAHDKVKHDHPVIAHALDRQTLAAVDTSAAGGGTI